MLAGASELIVETPQNVLILRVIATVDIVQEDRTTSGLEPEVHIIHKLRSYTSYHELLSETHPMFVTVSTFT